MQNMNRRKRATGLAVRVSVMMIVAGLYALPVFGHINPVLAARKAQVNKNNNQLGFRENCDNAVSQIDMAINNVRARLLTGGDVWWDSNDARYVVPKVPPGVPEVSSIFSGAVWIGGVDPGGNLKVAAQQHGRASGDFDFFPGPLNPETGKTDQETCAKWDKFFTVSGESIQEHLRNWNQARVEGREYKESDIPKDVRGWPGRGNRFFEDIHQFKLPNTRQGLAGFYDQNGNGDYEPDLGDFPVIEIRGCDEPQFPDQMTFWIYNDAGNIHAQSQGSPIQMEVQVQAFAYATNDEINDMTFQRYKLINRAIESIDSTFFAMWVDPDLGCPLDDYIGADTLRDLAYVYNQDALDGFTGCTCNIGGAINTYCDEVPILGVDYFRGPLDEFGVEIGMSSFTYFNNQGVTPAPPNGTTDPENAQEFYNYLSGSWKDGTPFTLGGDAYLDGIPVQYAFTDPPNDPNGWSMCTQALPPGDRRTIQASGPFRLDPGAVNELIIGVVWVPDQAYPCPSIRKLQEADDIAQALFDNCFEITDGPDAPDLDFIELDRELIVIMTNDTVTSNNAFEAYAQRGLQIPALVQDSLYRFEGYKLYQLSGPNVTIADLDNVSKARLVYQVDVENKVGRVFNWTTVDNPTGEEYYVPVLEVEGSNGGIRHTFRITEDQFAEGDRRLINHKKYYFTAVAYAHNEYEPFDPENIIGQRQPYLEGRRNIGDGENPFYTVIPRPVVDRSLMAQYGDGAIITRIDGEGTGLNFLDISDETREAILKDEFNGEITYKEGRGPIEVNIFNPLDVVDGEYELTFVDENMANDRLDNQVRWVLRNLSLPGSPVISSQSTIERLNEEIIKEYGFTVTVGQVPDAGGLRGGSNGVIGYEESYTDPNAAPWLTGVKDDFIPGPLDIDDVVFNYVATGDGEADAAIDPDQAFTNIGPGYFIPYYLADWRPKNEQNLPYITPAWSDNSGSSIVRNQSTISSLNNVDIVFTSNKDLWSRCVVVETNNRFFELEGFSAAGQRKSFDLRAAPSVTKFDNNGDGLPDVDTEDTGEGMGWFPGYAIDVETGQRLNIFFGENSVYNGDFFEEGYLAPPTGQDMMFNPSGQLILGTGGLPTSYRYYAGGHHFIYVTRQPYDGCTLLRTRFRPAPVSLVKINAIKDITWTGLVMSGTPFKSYQEGLIPEDLVVKLRVNNPYQVKTGTGAYRGYPTYRFTVAAKQAAALEGPTLENALNQINVVPNPYRGYADYETSQFTNVVKITNLPAKCTVTIFSLDGKFIRQYQRDERGAVPRGNNRAVEQNQITPALEWDLKNSKGIPIASGVYLIHVEAEGLGARTIKWFGINRQFDPTGL